LEKIVVGMVALLCVLVGAGRVFEAIPERVDCVGKDECIYRGRHMIPRDGEARFLVSVGKQSAMHVNVNTSHYRGQGKPLFRRAEWGRNPNDDCNTFLDFGPLHGQKAKADRRNLRSDEMEPGTYSFYLQFVQHDTHWEEFDEYPFYDDEDGDDAPSFNIFINITAVPPSLLERAAQWLGL